MTEEVRNQINILNNSVYCRLAPSKIHGIGVFAIRDIPMGTYLTLARDFRIPSGYFHLILPEIQELILDRMVFRLSETLFWFQSPNKDANLVAFMNHSDDPNSNGNYAIRDIKKGEEVTEDFRRFGSLHPISQKHLSFL